MRASAAGGRPRAGRPGDLRAPHDAADQFDRLERRLAWAQLCVPLVAFLIMLVAMLV